jgi:PAS domain-containing protein
VALEGCDGTESDWYELTAIQSGDMTVFHASCINAVIAAENTQRNYMQTLAKTFAHLSIGLAIFDRKGQLLMFNPALVDLTGLSAPFLSGRPAMLSFFDAMRENRRMPEPKNYRSWRQEIADVMSAAADSRYQETWTLESGQTYNVTGRQHPDGATAFLIEDISAEMTLTRNYRVELEQAQIMVDAVEDAMAIFSPSGVLTLSNSAFGALWGIDADAAFADMTLHDCTRIWKSSCVLATDLALLDRTFSRTLVGVPQDVIFAQRTREMRCIVTHLASGSLLVQFRAQPIHQKKTPIVVQQTA